MSRDVPRGDIPTLILAVLSEEPTHGYAIARAVERKSGAVLRMREGSLYPALRVLEEAKHIAGAWETPERGPARKVYTLTDAGARELAERVRRWEAYAGAVQSVLRVKGSSNA